MLIILLSWLYIVFTTINFGVLTDRIIVLKNKNFAITCFLGLFAITILASIWAVFGRINIEFHLLLLLCNLIIFIKCKNQIQDVYVQFWIELCNLTKSLKIYLILVSLLILAQCATLPFIIDNETYYIQTIKWLNEYGFVKGLANLHLYLGQTSGWHITQSVFNFSFLNASFNDLSGFCLLLGVVFSTQMLHSYFQNKNLTFLVVGLFPLGNIYFLNFINAPSPDIPIYVLTFIVLFYFLDNFKKCSVETFNLIVILVLFMLYIKTTSFIFALIPIFLFFRKFHSLKKKLLASTITCLLILTLFIVKNTIISGSVLFPSTVIHSLPADYSIPKKIEIWYYFYVQGFGFGTSTQEYQSMSCFNLLINWVTMPKLNGMLNKISLFIIVIVPFFLYKFQNKNKFWVVYAFMVLQLLILFFTTPQYRFFMNFILFFSLFCFACFFINKKFNPIILTIVLIPNALLLFFPANLTPLTNNNLMNESSFFTSTEIIFPRENTKLQNNFEVIKLGNFTFNSPVEDKLMWIGGSGDLPCVNKRQIEFFEKNFGYIPQMRTDNLKDGFYSKKITEDE